MMTNCLHVFALQLILVVWWGGKACTASRATCRDSLGLNHMQVIGTHNSYHQNSYPDTLPVFDYGHPPLTEQLEEKNVRLVELDLYSPVIDSSQPSGFIIPVNHVVGFDDQVTCDNLAECLNPLDTWSTSAYNASLLIVMIEIKQQFSPADWDIFDDICRQYWDGGQRIITPASLTVEGMTLRESIVDTLGIDGHPGGGWPRLSTTARHAMFLLDLPYTNYIAELSPRVAFPMFDASSSDDAAGQAVVLKINTPDVALIQDKVAQGYLVRTRADADVPFHRWTDDEIVTGMFNMLAADADTVSEARLVTFLMVTGTPVNEALVGQLIALCGAPGSPLSLLQFNCVISVARANGVEALPLASSLPLGSDAYDRMYQALSSGAQFISSDYAGPAPPEGSVWSYHVSFPSGLPVACNPITTRNGSSAGTSSRLLCSDIDVNAAAVDFRNNVFRHRRRGDCGHANSRSKSSDGSGESSDSSEDDSSRR